MHGHALAAGAAPATLSSPAAARGLPLFGLALLAGLLCVCERLLQDPDTQWHIAVGRAIWDSGRVPRTDPFSHTFAGAPWIAKEWLSQLLLFAAHATAGWRGVAVLACVAIAVSFTLLLGFLQGRIDPTRALMATLVAILLSAGQLLARPHVLTLPILVVWTGCLMRAVERRAPPPWGLLWLMAVWANLHAGFAIGFAVAGLLAAEAVLAGGPAGRAGRAARWGLFLAGALAASCASPYGWRPLAVGAALLGSGEPLPYIGEWQPLGLDPTGVAAVGALLLLLAALGLRPRRNLFRLLIVALFGAMMIRHVRFLVLFALVAPIVAAGPLAAAFPRLAPRAGPRPSRQAVVARRAAVVGLALLALALAALPAPEPSRAVTPAAAVRAARDQGLAGPVYNDYDFGGYLVAQGVPTFIDGRTDQLFLGGFISSLNRALDRPDGTDFLAILDRYGVTWALVKPASDEVRHLAAAGWREVHRDAVAVTFARR